MYILGVADITVYAGKSLASIYSENPRDLIIQDSNTRLGVWGKGAGQYLKKWKVTNGGFVFMKKW